MASNGATLVQNLDRLRCPHSHVKGVHEPLGGSNTKRSELYSDALVNRIHSAWADSCKMQARTPNEGYALSGPKPGWVKPTVGCGKSSGGLVAVASTSPTASPTETPTESPTTKPMLGAYNTVAEMPIRPYTPQTQRQKLKNKVCRALGTRRVFAPDIKLFTKLQNLRMKLTQLTNRQPLILRMSIIGRLSSSVVRTIPTLDLQDPRSGRCVG